MSTDGSNYAVKVEEYAERHFIKGFSKKYKNAWEVTLTAIKEELSRAENLLFTDRAETIFSKSDKKILKLYFRVAGTNQSAKSSGNRAIVYLDGENRECSVLLVYSKNDICAPNETVKWQTQIRENYPEIWKIFNKN